MVVALSGRYEQILNYVVSMDFLFFGLTGASLFVFRRREVAPAKGYRVPGHPLTTAVFVLISLAGGDQYDLQVSEEQPAGLWRFCCWACRFMHSGRPPQSSNQGIMTVSRTRAHSPYMEFAKLGPRSDGAEKTSRTHARSPYMQYAKSRSRPEVQPGLPAAS